MRAVELYYTPNETALLVRLDVKTVLKKLRAGEFGRTVVNLGSQVRPDYRIPASALNAWLDGRRVFFEEGEEPGVRACSQHELRRKAGAAVAV